MEASSLEAISQESVRIQDQPLHSLRTAPEGSFTKEGNPNYLRIFWFLDVFFVVVVFVFCWFYFLAVALGFLLFLCAPLFVAFFACCFVLSFPVCFVVRPSPKPCHAQDTIDENPLLSIQVGGRGNWS